LARYGVVGISNTLLSAACYAALVSLDAVAVAAATVAFALGSVNGFLWNRRWTFAGSEAASPLRYVAVQAAGLAYLVTTGTVTLATFAANRRFSFGRTVYP
jgi:putative flippase GtrA